MCPGMRPFWLGSGRFVWRTGMGRGLSLYKRWDKASTYGDHDIVSVLLSNAFQALSYGGSSEASCSNSLQRGVDGRYGESRHCRDVGGEEQDSDEMDCR